MFSITLITIILTCFISFTAFSNHQIIEHFIFNPKAVSHQNQWYRFISSGFIHADFMHLAFNMYTLYLFGGMVENAFTEIFASNGKALFVILYLTTLIISIVPTYLNHLQNPYYRSLGASGAVSGIIFVGILLNPTMGLSIFPIPISIPAFIFGPIYLIISAWMAKKGAGNINHSAHIWGAIFGIIFMIIVCQFMSEFRPIQYFIHEIAAYLR